MYTDYSRITTIKAAEKAIRAAIGPYGDIPIGLDLETTSLDPSDGRVRTINISSDDPAGRAVIDCDKLRGGFKRLAPLFDGRHCYVFYAGFERKWFDAVGVNINHLDVGHQRRAVMGGGPLSLKMQAKLDLDYEMSKEQQVSNWNAKVLTDEQWDYAFLDAEITRRLGWMWHKRIANGADQWKASRLFNDMVPAVMEMEQSGMLLDARQHRALTNGWALDKAKSHKKLREAIGEDEVKNLGSDAQLSDYFSLNMPATVVADWPKTAKTGQLSMKSENLRPIAARFHDTPVANFLNDLMEYKHVSKYLSSFGETLITSSGLEADGRIRARFNIAAAKTGRFSSSSPNLQQMPRGNHVRESFIAPRGRRLVSLDYSGIELRCLALLSGDENMLQDTIYGDLHKEVAQSLAGHPLDLKKKKHKALRQSAKAISFGIIYGSGPTGLAATTRRSIDDASAMIDAWEKRYPVAYAMRFKWQAEAKKTGYLTCVDGGTIWVGKKASLPVCANYPVQRAALSVMARAIIRHKNTLDTMRRNVTGWGHAKLLATIHDALIDECHTRYAGRVMKLMKADMTAAYLDIFPGAATDNLMEGGSGPNWGTLS